MPRLPASPPSRPAPAAVPSSSAAALAGDLRALISQLNKRLREKASLDGVSWPQKRVLLYLEQHGPTSVSALAQAEGMRPQSMGETVAALKTAGMLLGEPDPADGRRTLLTLAPAFVQAVRAGRAAREDWLHEVIQARLSAAEQKQLAAALLLLKRLADD